MPRLSRPSRPPPPRRSRPLLSRTSRPRPFAFAPALLLAAACAGGGGVTVHYDPGARVLTPNYTTWTWMPAPADRTPEEAALDADIRRITDGLLTGKGYAPADSGAHFRFGWHLTGDTSVVVSAVNLRYGYTWGRWVDGGGVNFAGRYLVDFPPHSLVIDVADGRARELMWRSFTQVDPDRLADAGDRDVYLTETLRKLLEKFPGG